LFVVVRSQDPPWIGENEVAVAIFPELLGVRALSLDLRLLIRISTIFTSGLYSRVWGG
jgi:hypothetical protein